jgi:uncharacterized protein YybS (DUF2232 family)
VDAALAQPGINWTLVDFSLAMSNRLKHCYLIVQMFHGTPTYQTVLVFESIFWTAKCCVLGLVMSSKSTGEL